MQQSNGYIIGFTIGLTVILGGLLSVANISLKEKQKQEIELDTKKQILGAVMETAGRDKLELQDIYTARIQSIVVDATGKEVAEYGFSKPEDVNIYKEYKKKDKNNKFFPVFKYMKEGSETEVDAYIIPIYGFGLWDYIWGYAAIDSDLNTLRGVVFDHKGETPGLGARITDAEIQARYKSKKLFDNAKALQSVNMVKGEGNTGLGDHEVDGMSGATITANGVNDMLKAYFELYKPYFDNI